MNKSFHFYIDGHRSFSPTPSFRTAALHIGELYLRSPETFGLRIPDVARQKILELFPDRDDIQIALFALQTEGRCRLLEQIPGMSVRYKEKH